MFGRITRMYLAFIILIVFFIGVEGRATNQTPSSNNTSTNQTLSNDTSNNPANNTDGEQIQLYDQTIDLSGLTVSGDILFTKEQLEQELPVDDGETKKRRRRRNTPTHAVKLWKDGIVPYVMYLIGDEQKAILQKKMRIIQRLSCIRFVEYSFFDVNLPKDYLLIYPGSRCFSTVGSGNAPLNILSLNYPGCYQASTIFHELLHTLGFYHEQQRLDRNNHVKVNWQNIQPGQEYNFRQIRTFIPQTQKYNTRSIMHYKSNDFSKNGMPTIECIDNPSKCRLGGEWMRWTDLRQLNAMYNCSRRKC